MGKTRLFLLLLNSFFFKYIYPSGSIYKKKKLKKFLIQKYGGFRFCRYGYLPDNQVAPVPPSLFTTFLHSFTIFIRYFTACISWNKLCIKNIRNLLVRRFAEPKRHPLIKYNCVLNCNDAHTNLHIFYQMFPCLWLSVIDCKDKKSSAIKVKMLLESNIL